MPPLFLCRAAEVSRCVQVGLATVAAGVQRAGGSVQHPSAALDDALEQKAAYIEGGASPETSSLGRHHPLLSHHYQLSACILHPILFTSPMSLRMLLLCQTASVLILTSSQSAICTSFCLSRLSCCMCCYSVKKSMSPMAICHSS